MKKGARPPVVCLMGPTATGKTEFALALAAQFPLDIVSVDSALVYRGMDVGTAKPDPATLRTVPHALVDIRDPEQSYSAGDFVRDARAEIASSFDRDRVPLLVGGTMMYFRSLTAGIAELPEADATVRAEIDREAAAAGWEAMHGELRRVDEEAAARIDPNDSQRIQRALEVFRISGRPLSDWQAAAPAVQNEFDYLKIGLVPASRPELHSRIETRLQKMLAAGFVEEVAALRSRPGLTAAHTSMRSVGYRQLWAHLDGADSLEAAAQRATAATRQLAKRQLTWLRSEKALERVDPFEEGAAGTVRKLLHDTLSE